MPDGISNYEILELATEQGVNLKLEDIIMADELTLKPLKKRMQLIINLQPKSQGGSHWVALIIHGKYALYCDSYGADPDANVVAYCKKHRLHLACNSYVIQHVKSTQCGRYCFALIKYIQEDLLVDAPAEYKVRLYELANNFCNLYEGDCKKNDAILTKYLGSRKFV